ncbi:alpha/beta fold hydrolase [Propylenella binzhouense]|uniref:Alpha/beta hydrolase n=1 Tax=Propylenella binzhouense TaxID=2555902 RepID=A0A964T4Y3_9HYPH|nr:alpha/beta hydrolase [Propylenella binzhouense]MYZ48538.1 alpha/beta hydrolase [Propylenella binzhouense]
MGFGRSMIRVAVEDGVSLAVTVAGPSDGPLVVLLHGFPEGAYGWRRQVDPLAEAGFRVAVPDQRGYGDSGKPEEVAAYGMSRLAADAAAVADHLGAAEFDLVGHDWGGVVAWWAAARYRERVRRLVILNAPHPVAMPRYARRHRSQLVRSWYVAFFQLPVLPEWALSRGDFALLASALRRSAPRGLFGTADMEAYREAWRRPGSLRGMVNWYRAVRGFRARSAEARIPQPTLVLWGERDVFLEPGLAEASAGLADKAVVLRYPQAGHWLQHEAAEAVNAAILQFLDRGCGLPEREGAAHA